MSETTHPEAKHASHAAPLQVRSPGIQLDEGPLVWSKVPEFSMTYNGASIIIPYVEYYLNSIMNKVRAEHCADKPALRDELALFVKQEMVHSQYHNRFNKRMFEEIPELKTIADKMSSDLKAQRERRSIAFNAAYCVGFESIATYDSKYLHEACDDLFEGAHPHGANLLLWHVAEEFEHRSVCHEAYNAVSGRYFMRLYATLYAFWHIGGAFLQAEAMIHRHYTKQLPEHERKASERRAKSLFRRHMRYLVPRMLKVFVPWYNPARLSMPARIQAALKYFQTGDPITYCARPYADINSVSR